MSPRRIPIRAGATTTKAATTLTDGGEYDEMAANTMVSATTIEDVTTLTSNDSSSHN